MSDLLRATVPVPRTVPGTQKVFHKYLFEELTNKHTEVTALHHAPSSGLI